MLQQLGRYKILAELGKGAMGTVYKAVDPMIDRTVAIKTIKLDLTPAELEEYEGRFAQEVKATGKLTHPNIVTVFDVGRTEKVAYMAMEFLEGVELKDLVKTQTSLTIQTILDVGIQVAEGLAFAHDQDIVHRDIKPSNIMILKSGLAKITDFGIARLPNSAVKTMTGMILGSPRYMSPEQVIGRQLDHRTDIFSLGVVLYEAITGLPPFDGDNVNAIMYATVNKDPVPPSQHRRDVPAALDSVLLRAMAKKVDDRYTTARDFAQAMRDVWISLGGVQATPLQMTQPLRTIGGTTDPSLRTNGQGAHVKTQPQSPAPGDATLASAATQIVRPEKSAAKPAEAAPRAVEPLKPLKLAKDFDNLEATMKLAKATEQTEQFNDYLTATQKIRAYKIQQSAAKLPAAQKPAVEPVDISRANDGVKTVAWLSVALLVLIALTLAVFLFF